jgi:hypothetical protein
VLKVDLVSFEVLLDLKVYQAYQACQVIRETSDCLAIMHHVAAKVKRELTVVIAHRLFLD